MNIARPFQERAWPAEAQFLASSSEDPAPSRAEMSQGFSAIRGEVTNLRSEVQAGFAGVDKDIDKLARTTHDEFEAVHQSFEKLSEKLDALTVTVTRDHAYDIERLRVDVDRLKQHVGLS